jgi:hypothetical protein
VSDKLMDCVTHVELGKRFCKKQEGAESPSPASSNGNSHKSDSKMLITVHLGTCTAPTPSPCTACMDPHPAGQAQRAPLLYGRKPAAHQVGFMRPSMCSPIPM